MRILAALALLLTGACSDPVAEPISPATSTSQSSTASTGGAGGSESGGGGEASGGAGGTASGIGLDCASAPSALLCDDFETGAIDAAKWSVVSNQGGSLAVDDAMALEGDYALHLVLPSADGAAAHLRAAIDGLFPLSQNAFFGRAFLYVDSAVPDTHSRLIRARGQLSDGEEAQYRLDCNGGELNSRYYTPTINEVVHGGLKKFGYEVPADTWLCVEWHYDGANHEMRYWIDGAAIDGMTVLSSEEPPWIAPEFEAFEIGWLTFQAGNSASEYHLFYDSIVLDTSRVGCGR